MAAEAKAKSRSTELALSDSETTAGEKRASGFASASKRHIAKCQRGCLTERPILNGLMLPTHLRVRIPRDVPDRLCHDMAGVTGSEEAVFHGGRGLFLRNVSLRLPDAAGGRDFPPRRINAVQVETGLPRAFHCETTED
jgi:hypothetical protein